MKRLLFFLSLCFICTAAVTEQISINWGADNQLYTTTTCEIGDDVILPSAPTKRGHIFKGWIAEHFNRGTWSTWSAVPNDASLYLSDSYNNTVPVNNDQIIIQNSSDYINIDNRVVIELYHIEQYRYLKIITNRTVVKDAAFKLENFPYNSEYGTENIRFKIVIDGRIASFIALTKIKYNDTVYNIGETIFSCSLYDNNRAYTLRDYAEDFSGTWRFIYRGTWEQDGKNGWKPETQITE